MAQDVPVIDISAWRSGRVADRRALALQVDAACRDIGFLHLAGHTLDDAAVRGLWHAVDWFFGQPLTAKTSLQSRSPDINRGYAPSGAEGLGYSIGVDGPPDLFEAFNVGPDDASDDDPAVASERAGVFAPNLWPTGSADATDFRQAVDTYFRAVRRQAHELTAILAAALELEPLYFEAFTRHSTDVLRLNNYGVAASGDRHGLGMGAHTDYGIVTLLLADPVPGLEVLFPDGAWTPVTPMPGHLLINLGDLLAQWTNDRWRSTLHRVQPPAAGQRRRSAAFFHDGDHDALIECLPTCHDAEHPPRYAPVHAGDHVRNKLLGPRTLQVSQATSTLGERTA